MFGHAERTVPLLSPDCFHHSGDANDVDHAREIVAEDTEGHLGRDLGLPPSKWSEPMLWF